MSKDEAVIKVNHVAKDFYLPRDRNNSIKSKIVNIFKRRDKGADLQHALKDISVEIKKGEFFGVVGRNGSGKSTLLKILAQIYQPTKGTVETHGKLVPFIELGVGFNPELSGRENVYLNGALLGFSREEIDVKYDEIVAFAELEEFMEQKLKNYSSGMQVRLAFSVATHASADVLIVDEVLAVGDEAFQRKCNDYFDKIRKNKSQTVVLVTHSMDAVRKYCDRAMMIRDGKVMVCGSPEDVANEYSIENLESMPNDAMEKETDSVRDFKVELLSPRRIAQHDAIEIAVSFKAKRNEECFVACVLQDMDRNNVPIVIRNSEIRKVAENATARFSTSFSLPDINDSNIKVLINVRNKNREVIAYYPYGLSPVVAVRRTDYPKHRITDSILYDYKEWK